MKKLIFIVTLSCIAGIIRSQSNTWSSCKGGFEYTFDGLFADTISDKLYASGFAGKVDGLQANCVAAWDGQKWDTLAHGALGAYGPFIIRYQNKLYVQKNRVIYAWDFNTQTWDTVPGSLNDGIIRSACITTNNELIIAGYFTHLGTSPIQNIARFDGTNFYPIGNPNFVVDIRTVAIYQDEIYIGGNFGSDTVRSAVAKWNGTQWVGLNYGFRGGGPPEVCDLKVYRNRLYAVGSWYGTIDKYMPSIAAWDGNKWSGLGSGVCWTWHPWGAGAQLHVNKNKLYVCGNFDRAAGLEVDNIAIWNDTNWCSMNTTFQSPVFLSTFFRDTLYIANHYKIDNDSTRVLGYYIGSNYMGTCGDPVGINETTLSENIKLYPNPTNSTLHIHDEQNELQGSTLEISNSIGQTVMQMHFSSSIDLSDLPTGCYFITITTSRKNVLRTKFIKE